MKEGLLTAVVLCGGTGSRIYELTKLIPKSLIKIQGYPLIWYTIKLLLKNNIKNIIFPLGYKGQMIKKYIKLKFPKNIENFSFINTGKFTEIHDRIKKIKHLIPDNNNFILINSDTIFDFNLKKMMNIHEKNKSLVTVSSVNMISSWGSFVQKKNNSYLFKFVKDHQLYNYNLKNFRSYMARRNSGISIINKKCLANFNYKTCKDFELDLFNKYAKLKKVCNYHFNSFWYPVETNKDIKLTKITSNKNKIKNNIKKLIKKFLK